MKRGLNAALTLALVGGSLGFGYLLSAGPPNWARWWTLLACQAALGGAAAGLPGVDRSAFRRLGVKTALWPVLALGLAGAARLARVEVYTHVAALAVAALGAAHILGEWMIRLTPLPPSLGPLGFTPGKLNDWLLDLQWMGAIAGAAWSWGLVSTGRLEQFLAAGALFLWLARPSFVPRGAGVETADERR